MNYCPKCGFELNNAKFCPMCGFNVSGEGRPKPQQESRKATRTFSQQELLIDDKKAKDKDDIRSLREALVGEKADHYVPIFEDLDKNGGSSWNWCGCLFSPMWFAYRKMYGWAAAAIAIPFAVSLFLYLAQAFTYSDVGVYLLGVVRLGLAVLFGILSNKEYKKRIDRLIVEIPTDSIAREKYIKDNGGVNVGGPILVLIILAAIRFGVGMLTA